MGAKRVKAFRVTEAIRKRENFFLGHVKEIRFDDFTRYLRVFRGGEWK